MTKRHWIVLALPLLVSCYIAPLPCVVPPAPPVVLDLEACDLADLKRATQKHTAAGLIEAAGCEALRDRLRELGAPVPLFVDGRLADCAGRVTLALGALRWQRFGGLYR